MPFAPRQHQADPARPPERFFEADAVAVEEPPDRTEPRRRASSRRRWISSSVRSGSCRTNPSNHSSCFFSGDRLCPLLDLASKLPVSRQRFAQRIAVESPITNCLAAARAAAPLSTTWITRTRRSFEYPIAASSGGRRPQNLIRASKGIPDSQKVETALECDKTN